MSELIINNELTMDCPEGFHVLSDEERSRMNMLREGEWTGMSDPERHIIASAGWEKPAFISVIMGANDIADVCEKRIRKALQPMGYKLESREERTIAGEKAAGICYGYTVQDTGMCAKTYAFRRGKYVYYFHFYYREALKEESLPVLEALLASVKTK
ncbi:MAG: hypothetical protein K6G61_10935 [Solobacterium sp.]|nr:hypothetical protein [Solobacterium sp.]